MSFASKIQGVSQTQIAWHKTAVARAISAFRFSLLNCSQVSRLFFDASTGNLEDADQYCWLILWLLDHQPYCGGFHQPNSRRIT